VRILVDTSVWGDFLNGYPSPEAEALAELLAGDEDICACGVIVAEVLQGLRREKGRRDVERLLRELTFLEAIGPDPYIKAAGLYRALRQRGKTVRSTIDCLIAVVAAENGCYVLAKDRDLGLVLDSGLVRARPWRVGRALS
jgi:predicted nucleic acid-binding protein